MWGGGLAVACLVLRSRRWNASDGVCADNPAGVERSLCAPVCGLEAVGFPARIGAGPLLPYGPGVCTDNPAELEAEGGGIPGWAVGNPPSRG